MRQRCALVLLVLSCAAGCLRPGPRNSECQWPPERTGTLDPGNSADRRHLSEDAELAEDLAIRYADTHRGVRSGHFEGMAEYARTRDRCMAGLFQTVAKTHGVSETEVRRSLGQRRTGLDVAVGLSFGLLYGLGAYLIAGWMNRRYANDERSWPGAAAMVMVYVSAIVSLGGVLLGELWSVLMESLRVGSGHLSYHGERIPWSHHGVALFAAGIVLFWILAAVQRRATPSPESTARAGGNRLLDLDSATR